MKSMVATSSATQNPIGMQSPRRLLLVNITLFAIIFAATLISSEQAFALTFEQVREQMGDLAVALA